VKKANSLTTPTRWLKSEKNIDNLGIICYCMYSVVLINVGSNVIDGSNLGKKGGEDKKP